MDRLRTLTSPRVAPHTRARDTGGSDDDYDDELSGLTPRASPAGAAGAMQLRTAARGMPQKSTHSAN